MIGTELLKGMGLGNRLFCYVTARSIAADHGVPFGVAGWENIAADFLKLDPGIPVPNPTAYHVYHEAEQRLYLKNSPHDMIHGCYVAGADPGIFQVPDDTILYGNLQAEDYFRTHREEIRQWLTVKRESESFHYTDDHLCILNLRGGEYAGDPALFLEKSYWIHAMQIMKAMDPAMRFMVITDDPESAHKLLPQLEIHHFDPSTDGGSTRTNLSDYVVLRNARYLILSNSSFAFFPAYTSETVKRVIAPKYWARYNVSDGYWASAQNIYDEFEYLGRDGHLYTPQQCRQELAAYHYPQTAPWQPDDPAVEQIRKRNERKRLMTLAVHKMTRMLRR